MARRSLTEQEEESAKLAALKAKIRETNAFGENIHEAIEAQRSVLDADMSDNDAYDLWGEGGNEESEYLLGEALEAVRWRDGEEDLPPSTNWLDLAEARPAE